MIYTKETETNERYFNLLRSQIKDTLLNLHHIYDEVHLEDATDHTIEQILIMKQKFAKDIIQNSLIMKAIKFSALKILRLNIKNWSVTKSEDEDWKTIYINEYKVVDIDRDDENTKSTIENLSSNSSLEVSDYIDIKFIITNVKNNMNETNWKIAFWMLTWLSNKEIAESINRKIDTVIKGKKKIKEYLIENKEKFIIKD